MAAFVRFECFAADLAEKKHDLGTDQLKVCLTNTEPDPAVDLDLSDIVEISAGNGYTAGGEDVTTLSAANVNGVYELEFDDVVFTASGGTIGPFQYVALYNSDASDILLGYYDYGAPVTLADTETLLVEYSATGVAIEIG
jgi:hypothetical protein